jgi:hypothetical protein
MIYKLIVNAAFLAIGYYIGKEVCRSDSIHKELGEQPKSATKFTTEPRTKDSKKPNS